MILDEHKGVSVVICCYNSATRLPDTLRYLSFQEVPDFIPWEIIIVNNASTDSTKEVALNQWEKYLLPRVLFTVIDEMKPGLSNAREKGVEKSKYEYLIFCDDDNWLNSNYVSEAYNCMEANVEAGAIGGVGDPICEVEVPEWFFNNKLAYAVGSQGNEVGEPTELLIEDITETKRYVYGAGAVFRKKSLNDLRKGGFKNIVTDRIGNVLVSGGDNELCYGLIIFGYKILYNPNLAFKHFIPASRLTEHYIIKLGEGYAISSTLLLPYEYRLNNKQLSGIKTKWWWLLGSAVFLYIKNEVPHMFNLNSNKSFSLKVRIAIRKGTIKSIWNYRKMFPKNFCYLNSLVSDR